MSYDERAVVARIRRLSLRELRLWVREGWVRPIAGEAGPRFDEVDIARIRLLRDLRKDMALSAETLPLVLSLIDRLNRTRRELHCLQRALRDQPEEIRNRVVENYTAMREDTGE